MSSSTLQEGSRPSLLVQLGVLILSLHLDIVGLPVGGRTAVTLPTLSRHSSVVPPAHVSRRSTPLASVSRSPLSPPPMFGAPLAPFSSRCLPRPYANLRSSTAGLSPLVGCRPRCLPGLYAGVAIHGLLGREGLATQGLAQLVSSRGDHYVCSSQKQGPLAAAATVIDLIDTASLPPAPFMASVPMEFLHMGHPFPGPPGLLSSGIHSMGRC